MNQSVREQRHLHEQNHKTSNNRYTYLFYGYCYECHIFGHKDVYCKNIKFEKYENSRYIKYQNFRSQNSPLRDRNSFSPMLSDVESFKCNNFWHKENERRSIF